jgi:hypothetical protein
MTPNDFGGGFQRNFSAPVPSLTDSIQPTTPGDWLFIVVAVIIQNERAGVNEFISQSNTDPFHPTPKNCYN